MLLSDGKGADDNDIEKENCYICVICKIDVHLFHI